MRNICSKQLLLAIALGMTAGLMNGGVLAQESRVQRILAGQSDGNLRVHAVRCTDKRWTSIEVEQDKARICATPQDGKKRCERKWTLNEAGEHACKAVR